MGRSPTGRLPAPNAFRHRQRLVSFWQRPNEEWGMQTTELSIAEGAIWNRMLDSDKPTLSPATAKDILALDFTEVDKARMHELAAKARAGTLTLAEAMEIDVYGRV